MFSYTPSIEGLGLSTCVRHYDRRLLDQVTAGRYVAIIALSVLTAAIYCYGPTACFVLVRIQYCFLLYS
jgi:hypothetical protein